MYWLDIWLLAKQEISTKARNPHYRMSIVIEKIVDFSLVQIFEEHLGVTNKGRRVEAFLNHQLYII